MWDKFEQQFLASGSPYINGSYAINITVDECATACDTANGIAFEFWVPQEYYVTQFNFTTICELYDSTADKANLTPVPDA